MRVNRGKLLRLAAILLAVLLLFLVAAYALLLWESHRQRQRAESLLRDFKALKIGETPAEEAMRLVREYGGDIETTSFLGSPCGKAVTVYRLRNVEFPRLAPYSSIRYQYIAYQFTKGLAFFSEIGIRPWSVGGNVVTEGERVVCWGLHAGVTRSDGLLLVSSLDVEPGWPERTTPPTPLPFFGHSGWSSYRAGVGWDSDPRAEILSVDLTHEATAMERARAFDINLDCLDAFRECRKVCELRPSVWREEVRKRIASGEKPLRGEPDPRCQAVLAAGEKKP